LLVNALGSALGGVALGLGSGLPDDIRLILLSGVAGGLTTFSTFSVETVQLVLDGRMRVAGLTVATNLAAGLTATAGAYWLVQIMPSCHSHCSARAARLGCAASPE